ncbi:hypothetical protein [Rhizobium bangladeshense]|uniref:hypothetical protein n=1 Tax=Rhizobium bangladeshense TaxID=1138189 RepID=UPI001C82F23B|nr:hypothetical protein [Rhizobium bangladeshense]MBX4916845.1 hypothetical protein [Rhizobium bangladeshense]MBX4922986.1 hypothetical protein [Rhizobium bangladeshense]
MSFDHNVSPQVSAALGDSCGLGAGSLLLHLRHQPDGEAAGGTVLPSRQIRSESLSAMISRFDDGGDDDCGIEGLGKRACA